MREPGTSAPTTGASTDQVVAQSNAEAVVHIAALNALAFGLAICDAEGRVAFTNTAAQELLDRKHGLALGRHGDELIAGTPEDSRKLARLLQSAARDQGGGVMRLTAAGHAIALLVFVAPLPRNPESDYGPGYALVTMSAPDAPQALTRETLVALFDLSPTQASIALAIFAGQSPEDIAEGRGIRISTLRTHLAEIFQRTGAENQRDLVRLLGTLPPLR
jgi:DNA-binding CsgD family transcriptional regulator